jgi:GlcNAc-P-P-Und epimerase
MTKAPIPVKKAVAKKPAAPKAEKAKAAKAPAARTPAPKTAKAAPKATAPKAKAPAAKAKAAAADTPLYERGPVLITGGSGFIGTHLINALLEKGVTVVNLDIRKPTLEAHSPYWVEGSIGDETFVHALIAKTRPALIYNLAANASLTAHPDALRVNSDGLGYIMDAAAELDPMPLVAHASTQLVAGPATGAFDPLALDPYTAYGESKAECERVLRRQPPSRRWIIFRPVNIWGPYHPTFGTGVWRYIAKRYYLHPAGKDVYRSYGYVENVVYQLLRIAELPPAEIDGKTFYVGDAPVISGQWLDGFAVALTGKPMRRLPLPLLQLMALGGEISGKLGGPSPINLGRLHRMTLNFPTPMEPTFAVLGQGPVPFAVGLERTVDWIRHGKIEAADPDRVE